MRSMKTATQVSCVFLKKAVCLQVPSTQVKPEQLFNMIISFTNKSIFPFSIRIQFKPGDKALTSYLPAEFRINSCCCPSELKTFKWVIAREMASYAKYMLDLGSYFAPPRPERRSSNTFEGVSAAYRAASVFG